MRKYETSLRILRSAFNVEESKEHNKEAKKESTKVIPHQNLGKLSNVETSIIYDFVNVKYP